MRRIIPPLVLVLLVAGARAGSAQGVEGGVKGGFNLATLTGAFGRPVTGTSQPLDKSRQFGATFGGFVTLPIAPQIAIQPEFLYSREGFHATGNLYAPGVGTVSSRDVHVGIDVLRMPVLFRFRAGAGSGSEGYGLAGLAIGWPLRATIDVNDRPAYTQENGLRSADVALVLGLGTTLSHFMVEARFMQGLSDINQQRSAGSGFLLIYESHRTQVISVLAGVSF